METPDCISSAISILGVPDRDRYSHPIIIFSFSECAVVATRLRFLFGWAVIDRDSTCRGRALHASNTSTEVRESKRLITHVQVCCLLHVWSPITPPQMDALSPLAGAFTPNPDIIFPRLDFSAAIFQIEIYLAGMSLALPVTERTLTMGQKMETRQRGIVAGRAPCLRLDLIHGHSRLSTFEHFSLMTKSLVPLHAKFPSRRHPNHPRIAGQCH